MVFPELHAVIVDDSEHALPLIVELVSLMGFSVKAFSCPVKALDYIKANAVDIVFTDYRMPRMNGLTLMEKTHAARPGIPVVMITAGDDPVLKKKAVEKNVAAFFDKPFNNAQFITRVTGVGLLRRYDKYVDALELKDSAFGRHTLRVSRYAGIIARGLKLSEPDPDLICRAAQLHDIGNHGIPDSILTRPGKLSYYEMETVKRHTRTGYDILQLRENPYMETAALIALTHHERFDGSGYPLGLRGHAIPVSGRVAAIADVFDVLTSGRPYKKPWSFEDGCSFIMDNQGSLFDPAAVAAFASDLRQVKSVYTQFADA